MELNATLTKAETNGRQASQSYGSLIENAIEVSRMTQAPLTSIVDEGEYSYLNGRKYHRRTIADSIWSRGGTPTDRAVDQSILDHDLRFRRMQAQS